MTPITLRPETQRKVADLMRDGNYADESDLIARAIDLMAEQKADAHLRRLLDEADQDIEEHGAIPFTPELVKDIWDEAVRDHKRGIAPQSDPDVWP